MLLFKKRTIRLVLLCGLFFSVVGDWIGSNGPEGMTSLVVIIGGRRPHLVPEKWRKRSGCVRDF